MELTALPVPRTSTPKKPTRRRHQSFALLPFGPAVFGLSGLATAVTPTML